MIVFGGRAVTNAGRMFGEFAAAVLTAAVFRRAVLDDGWPPRHRIWRKRSHQEHPLRDFCAAVRDAFWLR